MPAEIIKKYKLKSGSKVLDVGCKKGFLLHDLKELIPGIKIYGIEGSKYAINNALPSVKSFIKYSNKIDLNFSDNFFDMFPKESVKIEFKPIKNVNNDNLIFKVNSLFDIVN